MDIQTQDFVFNLTANTKTHTDWLTVVRFGLTTLLKSQITLITVLCSQAARLAKENDSLPCDELAGILSELGLQVSTRPPGTPQNIYCGCEPS